METERKEPKRDMYFEMLVLRLAAVILALIFLLATRLFFKDTHSDIKKWYKEELCRDISAQSLLEGED